MFSLQFLLLLVVAISLRLLLKKKMLLLLLLLLKALKIVPVHAKVILLAARKILLPLLVALLNRLSNLSMKFPEEGKHTASASDFFRKRRLLLWGLVPGKCRASAVLLWS